MKHCLYSTVLKLSLMNFTTSVVWSRNLYRPTSRPSHEIIMGHIQSAAECHSAQLQQGSHLVYSCQYPQSNKLEYPDG